MSAEGAGVVGARIEAAKRLALAAADEADALRGGMDAARVIISALVLRFGVARVELSRAEILAAPRADIGGWEQGSVVITVPTREPEPAPEVPR